ncbi:hypothetical protein GCM10027280_22880 [Micromonospora polyrhachis]
METPSRPCGRDGDEIRSEPAGRVVSLTRTRVQFHALAAVVVVAVLTGWPGWTQVVLATTTLLIPVAVAVQERRVRLLPILLVPLNPVRGGTDASRVLRPVPDRTVPSADLRRDSR